MRDDALRRLVEALGRHQPRALTVPQAVSAIRRLVDRAHVMPDGCIVWTGARNNDHYGKLNFRVGRTTLQRYVHRLAYQLAHDGRDIPHWREIGHGCDCPPCFAPWHLECVRRRDNRVKSAQRTHAKVAHRRAADELARSMGAA